MRLSAPSSSRKLLASFVSTSPSPKSARTREGQIRVCLHMPGEGTHQEGAGKDTGPIYHSLDRRHSSFLDQRQLPLRAGHPQSRHSSPLKDLRGGSKAGPRLQRMKTAASEQFRVLAARGCGVSLRKGALGCSPPGAAWEAVGAGSPACGVEPPRSAGLRALVRARPLFSPAFPACTGGGAVPAAACGVGAGAAAGWPVRRAHASV